jgi:ureidoacrylate peracid hydrolase
MIAPLLTLDERLAEGRSALLVVDMQNDFCADGGYVSNLGRDTSPCRQIVPALTELIEAARTNAIPVIWLTAEYEDADVPAPMLAKKREMRVTAISGARTSSPSHRAGTNPSSSSIPTVAFPARTSTRSCARAISRRSS